MIEIFQAMKLRQKAPGAVAKFHGNMFVLLDHAEQRAAVLKLINSGMLDHTVAELTGRTVVQVRRMVAENRALAEQSS